MNYKITKIDTYRSPLFNSDFLLNVQHYSDGLLRVKFQYSGGEYGRATLTRRSHINRVIKSDGWQLIETQVNTKK